MALAGLASASMAAAGSFDDGLASARSGDFAGAARLWQSAADAGDPRAQTQLGALYAAGAGVERDDAKAVVWYEKAASGGDPEAQFDLTR